MTIREDIDPAGWLQSAFEVAQRMHDDFAADGKLQNVPTSHWRDVVNACEALIEAIAAARVANTLASDPLGLKAMRDAA